MQTTGRSVAQALSWVQVLEQARAQEQALEQALERAWLLQQTLEQVLGQLGGRQELIQAQALVWAWVRGTGARVGSSAGGGAGSSGGGGGGGGSGAVVTLVRLFVWVEVPMVTYADTHGHYLLHQT